MPRKTSEKTTSRKPRIKETSPANGTNPKEADIKTIINMGTGFKAKNKIQKDLAKLIQEHIMVIAAGPAGVGKSYVAIAVALELIKDTSNNFKKIVISKPAVEADEKHGFLPGDIRAKMDPFISSSIDIVDKIIGETNRLQLEELKILIIEPLAYLRGKSIDNSIVIMEEAQNMTPKQMKTLLTRIGDESKFIISGDLDQSDLFKDVTKSGLFDAINRHRNIPEIGFLEFDDTHIVRNPIISKILRNYDDKPHFAFKPTDKKSPIKDNPKPE